MHALYFMSYDGGTPIDGAPSQVSPAIRELHRTNAKVSIQRQSFQFLVYASRLCISRNHNKNTRFGLVIRDFGFEMIAIRDPLLIFIVIIMSGRSNFQTYFELL